METLFQALKDTPWWVYFLFIFLGYIGTRALKPRVTSVNKMFITPLLFIAWSLYSLIAGFKEVSDLLFFALAAAAGFFVGVTALSTVKKGLRVDKKKLLAYVPGSKIPLILILSIFALKYFLGYYGATHTAEEVHLASLIVSGAAGGIFVGRAYAFFQQFSKARHESLKKGGNPRKKSLL